MLELRFIRENIDLVKEKMRHRSMDDSAVDEFIEIDKRRRTNLSEVEGLRNRRKTVSQKIGKLKAAKEDADDLMLEMRQVGARIKELEGELAKVEESLQKNIAFTTYKEFGTIPKEF